MIKRIFIYLSIGFFTVMAQAMIETYPWVKFQIKYKACTLDMEKVYGMDSISGITEQDKKTVELFRAEICYKNEPIKENDYEFKD